jgi:hypothetical protein
MMDLSVLIQGDIKCAWCQKITGKTFMNSGIEKHQEHLKKFGHLTSHGICFTCQRELLETENIKRGACA